MVYIYHRNISYIWYYVNTNLVFFSALKHMDNTLLCIRFYFVITIHTLFFYYFVSSIYFFFNEPCKFGCKSKVWKKSNFHFCNLNYTHWNNGWQTPGLLDSPAIHRAQFTAAQFIAHNSSPAQFTAAQFIAHNSPQKK
jgi:hypothetical protein